MKEAKEFVDAFLEFDLTARSNAGYNAVLFEKTCAALRALGPAFRRTGCVPLAVANVLVDMYSAIESSSYQYEEPTKRQLLYAADQLAAIARELTGTTLFCDKSLRGNAGRQQSAFGPAANEGRSARRPATRGGLHSLVS
jgi:hypothetical protein